MLSKYVRKNDDCGCGGGKYNCVSKNTFARLLQAELKRLDCGCGCKGVKGFKKKYGLKGGKILADCPPGWRNDGLTCVENCNADERDDGLTCRKRCPEGQIDDGLTCRVPIKSSMNECPPGSRDIIGTCWGPVRRDCVDDCFKHPAPGCRTYECGRLRGLFGEDWGPRWCTDCNLRCGQTCWDVTGITKQLHERELRLWGGEVYGQAIRGKQIRGRVNFEELGKVVAAGIADLFEGRIDLAAAFDPERNGIGAAFRKFGDDMKRVLEDVGNSIKNAFDKMGADIKKAFEDFAKDAESKFKQFGEDFVNKMKDPDFWVEAIGIMAQIAAAAVSIAVTVGTLGAGTGLAVGLMAAAQMAGPAAKMIADAARGRPIDVLDIVQLAASAALAVVPGMSSTVGAMVKTGANAAKYAVQAVQIGQSLSLIPSTCIANCPPEPPFPPEPPIDPTPPPSDVPPPAGQKTDAEILDLAPPCTFLRVIGKPNQPAPCNVPPKVTRSGPPYYTDAEWIAKYRADNYGPGAANQTVEDESGALVDKDDDDIKAEVDATQGEQVNLTDVEVPELNEIDFGAPTGEIDFGEPAGEIDFGAPTEEIDFGEPLGEIDFGEPTGEIDFGEPIGDIDFGEELGAGKKRRKRRGGQLGPIIEPVTINGTVTNPGGYMLSLPAKANIPRDHTGAEFNIDCYIRKNPELAASVSNDKNKLTTHWLEVGSKEGWDASCGATSSKEERLKAFEELAKKEALKEGLKTACKAVDNYWVESSLTCDGMRHADGRENTLASKCRQEGSHWNSTGKNYCNKWRNTENNIKSKKELCNTINGHWANNTCDLSKNVDGVDKTASDFCVGFNNYYDPATNTCNVRKDRDGRPKSEQDICLDDGNYYGKLLQVNYARYGSAWVHGMDITKEIRELIVGNTIPSFDVNEFVRDKLKNADPHAYITKQITITYDSDNKTTYASQNERMPTIVGSPGQETCHKSHYPDGTPKGKQAYCQTVLHGNLHEGWLCAEQLGKFPVTYAEMETALNQKSLLDKPTNGRTDLSGIRGGAGKKQKSLTLYYANWCPHCHDMMPEWEKLGKTHKGVKIQAIEQAKSKRSDIAGFPTILFSDGQRETKYEGPRTKSGFVNFLKNNL
jgi:thiol-disulfide isomerase/thioredoxin